MFLMSLNKKRFCSIKKSVTKNKVFEVLNLQYIFGPKSPLLIFQYLNAKIVRTQTILFLSIIEIASNQNIDSRRSKSNRLRMAATKYQHYRLYPTKSKGRQTDVNKDEKSLQKSRIGMITVLEWSCGVIMNSLCTDFECFS